MTATQDSDEQKELPTFGEILEERARNRRRTATDRCDSFSVASFIEDELVLTLDQVDATRARWKGIQQELLRAECYIETELMQMEQRTSRYSPYRYPEREKLQGRLALIGRERRRLVLVVDRRLEELHDRLLSLLHKHDSLNPG